RAVVCDSTNFAGQTGAVRLTAGGALDTAYSGDGRAMAPFTSVPARDGANRVGSTVGVPRLGAAGRTGKCLCDAPANYFDEAIGAAAGPAGSIVTADYTSGASTQVLVTRLDPTP